MLFCLPCMNISRYSTLFSLKNWGKRGKSEDFVRKRPYEIPYEFCTKPVFALKTTKNEVKNAPFSEKFRQFRRQIRRKVRMPEIRCFRPAVTDCKQSCPAARKKGGPKRSPHAVLKVLFIEKLN